MPTREDIACELPPGLSLLTGNTLRSIESPLDTLRELNGATLALRILQLEAFLNALFTRDQIFCGLRGHNNKPFSISPHIDPILYRHTVTKSPSDLLFDHLLHEQEEEALTVLLARDEAFTRIMGMASGESVKPQFDDAEADRLEWVGRIRSAARATASDFLLAGDWRVPFYATQIESPLLVCDQLVRNGHTGHKRPASELALEILTNAWYGTARAANEIRKFDFYTVAMPMFFVAVLRECAENRPDAFWYVAREMRDFRETQAFREWTVNLDSEQNPKKFLKALDEVKGIANDFSRVTVEDLGTTRVTIGISTTGLKVEASREISDQSILDLLPWRKRHLRFMKRLLNDSAEAGLLESELERVFGVEPETAIEAVSLINSLLGLPR